MQPASSAKKQARQKFRKRKEQNLDKLGVHAPVLILAGKNALHTPLVIKYPCQVLQNT
jgi:hypothetical protein